MTGITKKQVLAQLGTSLFWLEELINVGVVQYVPGGKPRHRLIDTTSLDALQEGEHFVICPACGEKHGQITYMHTKSCLDLDLGQYRTKYPGVSMVCTLVEKLRAKTPDQKVAQSQKLKERFQTQEGEVTRQRIADASKKMQASPSGDGSKAILLELNRDPQVRIQRGVESRARWASGPLRDIVEGWHRDHQEESLASAANARRHIQKKRTKLHLGFKARLEAAGLTGFQTECEVGHYSIDEARPELKLSVEVMGCYWHSCPTCGFHGPSDNLRVDKAKRTYLTNRGWTLIEVWEHEINSNPEMCVERVALAVRNAEAQYGHGN